MKGGLYGVEQDVERAILAALPSDVADKDLLRMRARLDRTSVAEWKAEMPVVPKELRLIDLVDVHVAEPWNAEAEGGPRSCSSRKRATQAQSARDDAPAETHGRFLTCTLGRVQAQP
jgi:hypothetical protein